MVIPSLAQATLLSSFLAAFWEISPFSHCLPLRICSTFSLVDLALGEEEPTLYNSTEVSASRGHHAHRFSPNNDATARRKYRNAMLACDSGDNTICISTVYSFPKRTWFWRSGQEMMDPWSDASQGHARTLCRRFKRRLDKGRSPWR